MTGEPAAGAAGLGMESRASWPIGIDPFEALGDLVEMNEKVIRGLDILGRTREEDIRVGVTAREQVWREDKVTLYRFTPPAPRPGAVPILIVYALVNRPYMVDLQEDRSIVRKLLGLGMDVYLIDWGYPGPADRWLDLDDYINGYLDGCVDFLREDRGLEQVNLLGICQGGTFSLCYAALYPDKVKNLITMVAPVDFHVQEGLLNRWSRYMDVDLMVDALGNIPGEFLNFGFLMMKPIHLNLSKYVELLDIMDDERQLMNFLRMEKWIFDSPDQAGEAYREFMRDFYVGNKLIKDEVEIGGRNVRLDNVRMPVLNLYAEQDHLVPPRSSLALEKHVGSTDYTVRSFPVGHIGMYVSGKVQQELPPIIAEWVGQRG